MFNLFHIKALRLISCSQDYVQVFADSMECIHEEDENQESEIADCGSTESIDEVSIFNALEESTL